MSSCTKIISDSLLTFMTAVMSFARVNQKSKLPPVILFAMEEKIKPGRMQEYIEYSRKWFDIIKDLNMGLSFSAFGDQNGYLDYNQRINGPDDIGVKIEAWTKARELLFNTPWGKKRLKVVEWYKYSVWQRLPELSYDPAQANPNPNQLTYFMWKNIRVNALHENSFMQTGARIRMLFEKNDIERGYSVFRNFIGYESPIYSVIFAGKDPGEFCEWQQHTWSKLAAELQPLLDQLADSIGETIEFRAWAMPELSLSGK
jgi:hypothetical protein